MESLLSNPGLQAAKHDVLYFGSALLVSQLVSMRSVTDMAWLKASLLTLIGYVTFNVLLAKLTDPAKYSSGRVMLALKDVLKFGTMFVVARLLAGESVKDVNWLKGVGYVLFGFVSYQLLVAPYIRVPASLAREKYVVMISDTAKFGTMFLVSRLLAGAPLDKPWMVESAGFVGGLLAFDYLSK
jgi:hypothetical protein